MKNCLSILVVAVISIGCQTQSIEAQAAGITLVRDGIPRAIIAIAEDPDEHEQLAVNELQLHLEKISGAKVDAKTIKVDEAKSFIAETHAANKTPILIGRITRERLAKEFKKPPTRGAFVLQVADGAVRIHGLEEGSYYGVIELLEQLDCRWFMPGDLGTVIPKRETITIKEQTTKQSPSFASRHFQMPNREWQKRARCGGDVFRGGHGIKAPPYQRNKTTGAYEPGENAEYYGLVDGKRIGRQHCVSNPKLISYTVSAVKKLRAAGKGPVIAMGPNDGRGFCECTNCRALDGGDFDPFSNELSVTDRYIWFFNQVLAGVEDEYPDTKLAFYVYHSYMRPPLKWKPNPRIQGALAPISLDRVHGFSNPVAPEKSYLKWLFKEWGKVLPELYDRGYWSNLACPGFPFIIIDRLRDEIPVCHELGVKGWRVETFPNYGPQFPSMYVAARLMWDHTADVDALLDDCFEKFFGPAAQPMGQYIRLMDKALAKSEHCTGSSWDMPLHYPAALRKKARAYLNEGRKRASGEDAYGKRVKMITQTFDLLEAFVGMMESRVGHDFVKAKAELARMDEVAEKLMAYEPVPMLSSGRFSTYVNYMRRFFRHCTEQGYERVTAGNEVVAAANDEWQFQIDPLGIGEDIGLWRSEVTGGNWQRIKTSSSSWSNQGFRYYKGLAWYRQNLVVPKKFKGKRIFFWCGGVDESAKVWINGKEVGISHGAAMYPFELDATDQLKPGNNVVVVCVANNRVNEIGTGGILAPVMLYAPKKGKEAKLENVRDLKPTFP